MKMIFESILNTKEIIAKAKNHYCFQIINKFRTI